MSKITNVGSLIDKEKKMGLSREEKLIPAPIAPLTSSLVRSTSTASIASLMSRESDESVESFVSASSQVGLQASISIASTQSNSSARMTLDDFRTELLWKLAEYKFKPLYEVMYKNKYHFEDALRQIVTVKENGTLYYQKEAEFDKKLWPRMFFHVTNLIWEKGCSRNANPCLNPIEPLLEYILSMFHLGGEIRVGNQSDLAMISPKHALTGLILYAQSEMPRLKKEMGIDLQAPVKLYKSTPLPTHPPEKQAKKEYKPEVIKPKSRSSWKLLTNIVSSVWKNTSNFTPSSVTLSYESRRMPDAPQVRHQPKYP